MKNLQFTKPWALCIGSDRVSTMLRTEYWEHFKKLQTVMPVKYIRCHGLLCDELGVVRCLEHEGKKTIVYNFTYLDQIFDTMLNHHVKPYLEWGFMPSDLASGDQTIFWWKGNVTPPEDWTEWTNLLTSLTRHWIDRYGLEEVLCWPHEIWNEPNLNSFWKDADQKAYFHLYEISVLALKKIDNRIKVGGPAICGGSDHWIDDFLGFIKEKQLPLDYFTRHLYTAEPVTQKSPEFFYHYMAPIEKSIEELKTVRQRIDKHGFSDTPLHITEFNTSYNPRCLVHDTPFNAAYLARLLAEAGQYVDLMSFWTFSDLFEETDVPRALFHGGFGLIGRHEIKKPTFYLFEFFSKLSNDIVYQDEYSIVSKQAEGKYTIIAWNACPKDTEKNTLTKTVSLSWDQGKALALRQQVNERFCNPWGLWKTMGRPLNPSPLMIDHIRKHATPHIECAVIATSEKRLHISMSLEPNEVSCIEISRYTDESTNYIGLNDSLIDGYTHSVDLPEKLS